MQAPAFNRGVFSLFCIEFVVRFSYWGTMSIIVLYLSSAHSLAENKAYAVFGAFATFGFVGALLGGWVADKLSGFKQIMLSGTCALALGNLILIIFPGHTILGLSFISCGTGLLTPASANLLGQFYTQSEMARNRGFTYFYIATNIGGLLGPVYYSVIQEFSLKAAFLTSLIAIFLWVGTYFFAYEDFRNKGNTPIANFPKGLLSLATNSVTLVVGLVIFILMRHPIYMNYFLGVVAISISFILLSILIKLEKQARYNLVKLLGMIFIVLFFFSCEYQTNGSFLEFIQQFVNRNVAGFNVPSGVFASIEPAFVIVVSMFLIWAFKIVRGEPSMLNKQAIGLLLQGLSFIIIALLAWEVTTGNSKISLLPIFIVMLLLGAAEVFIMPTTMSAISKLAPEKIKGTIMGLLYLALAYSGYFAGLIAKLTDNNPNKNMNFGFINTYENIAKFAILIAVFIIILKIYKVLRYKSKQSSI